MRREERGSTGGDQQLRGQYTLAWKYMYEKLTKFPNLTRHLPEKYLPVFSEGIPHALWSLTRMRAGRGQEREGSWNSAADWLRPALTR